MPPLPSRIANLTVQAGGGSSRAMFLAPMLAEASPPSRVPPPLRGSPGEWLFEPKMDGLRCLAVRNGREVTLCSRNNLPFNSRFGVIASEVAALPAGNFVLDGEVVAFFEGRPDFAVLQQGNAASVEYWVFDLPWLLGRDLRHLPIEERKSLLAKAVPESEHVKVVGEISGAPQQLYDEACKAGWEGLVAKRAGSPYRAGRSPDWWKLKCGCRQEFVIGGFTAPGGSRTAFGALLLGYWQGDELAYAGKVGTGFNETTLSQLLARFVRLERPTSPFATRINEKLARWVDPELVAEVGFTNWTPEGRLRHPSFLGLRPDKVSRDVTREPCGPGAAPRS